MNTVDRKYRGNPILRALMYIFLILLAIISLMPFIIMIVNATRSTTEITTSQLADTL